MAMLELPMRTPSKNLVFKMSKLRMLLSHQVALGVFLSILLLISLSAQNKHLSDTDIKESILKYHRIQPRWHQMEVIRTFPNEEDVHASLYFGNPVDACQVNNHIYVADYGLGRITIIDKAGQFVGSFGRRGQGPGEFSRVGQIAGSASGEIFIVDSARIQSFSSDGRFLRTFKIFPIVNDMVVRRGELLVNPIYGDYGTEKRSLMLSFDAHGNPRESFGERIDQKGHSSVDSRAYVNLFKGNLIVAFKHYPVFRIYDEKGGLSLESKINIPVLARLERYNYDKKFTNPAPGIISLTRLIAGIQIIQDRIFILLHLPRIEIHEIDLSGEIIHSHYSNHINDVHDYGGFILLQNGTEYYAYVVSKSPENTLLSILKIRSILDVRHNR